jgi:hypothetical protein
MIHHIMKLPFCHEDIYLCAVAKTIVNMEQSYVTAAFFRHRTAERYKAMMQAQQTARLLGEGAPCAPAAQKPDMIKEDAVACPPTSKLPLRRSIDR